MLRTQSCGALRLQDVNATVTLCGWVQSSRDLGGMTFIDLRDRYGKTQLVFNIEQDPALCEKARELGREYVIQASGIVVERYNKNPQIPTGEIEIEVRELKILNASKTPPFTIEDESDGGDDLRMRYRYLDLRRNPVKEKLVLRHNVALEIRNYLSEKGFLEIETPFLIKSTPEGARDFVVPSRMNPGEFYALPQSPQTFKQLLMVSGYDRYFQLVRCFRDEDLRADRQPEFTQLDCEMSFIEQEDILITFENLVRHLFHKIKGVTLPEFPRMTFDHAMEMYGCDKPDLRFGMRFHDLTTALQGHGFSIFDQAELIAGICVPGVAAWSRKELDAITEWVKRPQIGAKGLVYCKINEDGTTKSSVDKFYDEAARAEWVKHFNGQPGDLLLLLSGEKNTTRKQLSELRLEMGNKLGLRDPNAYVPLWVVDFPLVEWDEASQRWHAMHHPFTSPKLEDIALIKSNPGSIRANAYDMVINGVELGGGSIRIHQKELQKSMFQLLGFTDEEAQKQFGFLMDAFEYGAPPHGGIAFGLDRLVAMMGGSESIRDFIPFPKNNSGRDLMINAPSLISDDQLKELNIALHLPVENH